MTALSSHIYSAFEDKSKGIFVQKPLLQSCSTDKDESKGIFVNKTLSKSCSNDKDELCSTEEEKSEYTFIIIKMERMRLHMMCRTILMPLTYSDTEEIFWTDLTWHMKERAWSLQKKKNLCRCWILSLNIIVVTAH